MRQLFPEIAHALGWALLHFLWQGLVIALLLAVLLKLMEKAGSKARYMTSYIAMLTCLAITFREFLMRLRTAPANTLVDGVDNSMVSTAFQQQGWTQWLMPLESYMSEMVTVWLVCVALLALRMSLGLSWINGYAKSTRSKPDLCWQARVDNLLHQFPIRGKVLVRVVDELRTPLAVGVFRPMILLPASMLTGMPADLLEMLVAHEMAHIKRHDYLFNLIQSVIEMLLFYHPAVWWIAKQIRNSREEIADELAARVTGEPRRLALALSELVNHQLLTPQLAQAAHGGNLMSRIKRLLNPEMKNTGARGSASLVVSAVVSIVAATVGLAAASFVYAAHAISTVPVQAAVLSSSAPLPLAANTTVPQSGKQIETASAEKIEVKQAQLQTSSKTVSKSRPVPVPAKPAPTEQASPEDKTANKLTDPGSSNKDNESADNKIVTGKKEDITDFQACYPKYPRAALRQNHTGATALGFLVKPDGVIDEVTVLKSSGFDTLDQAAVAAFQDCQVKPALLDGKPVALRKKLRFLWKIT